MFDPVTAAFLRTAPELPGLDPADLPVTFTQRYAELIARRLRRTEGVAPEEREDEGAWPLTRIADAYELITSTHNDPDVRRAAAFVAGTAQQILHKEAEGAGGIDGPLVDRDRVDPVLAAPLLFLAAEQYADANEAAREVQPGRPEQALVETLLAEDIRDLAAGNLGSILERARRRPARLARRGGLEEQGYLALLEGLLIGIELFATEALSEPAPAAETPGVPDGPRTTFSRIRALATNAYDAGDAAVGTLLTSYPGPRHLASLLLNAYDGAASAATTRVDPPPGVDGEFWHRWLRHRANTAPFLWHNHREAVDKGFHLPGRSAVMVLPTGAGKTTVSCLKIAATLAGGKNVIFIAPTHALVEQLTVDLQEIFPEDILGSSVSSDFDRLFAGGMPIGKIEVMTPERCLALLSYAPQAFADVGLLAFDECHLLSPISGLRRALDGMFCVLGFNSIAPEADFLFLSAMVRNGGEFAEWIGSLTGRQCVFVDPLWKPSRQARGVVFYQEASIVDRRRVTLAAQREGDRAARKIAKGLRAAARAELHATPWALFGLQHNWLHTETSTADCAITRVLETDVALGGELRYGNIAIKPNVNAVAAEIAAASARNGLKAIVFVNVKAHAVSTAKAITAAIGVNPTPTRDEADRWDALEAELGGLQYSLLDGPSAAVPHNALMLRLERDLAERMYRRSDGAKVIVATPTLAQGLNLPAHLAILASDMRADPDEGGRQALSAHEILNAAARAGRAGHLANGVVLLIPEAILTFAEGRPLDGETIAKLQSVLPEDDRCLDINDPLQVVLDRINTAQLNDPDVEYALNRLSTTIGPEGLETEATTRFALAKSLAAFRAQRDATTEEFERRVARLRVVLSERNGDAEDRGLLELAAQSGAPISALRALRELLTAHLAALPETIAGWVGWVITWLADDEPSRMALLGRDRRAILGAVGRKKDGPLDAEAIRGLLPGCSAWLSGKTLREIETALGGNTEGGSKCPRARELVTAILPLGLSFVVGLVARAAQEKEEVLDGHATPRSVVESLPSAIRRGFDTPSKLAYAELKKGLLSRVQIHRNFAAEVGEELMIERSADYGSLVALMRGRVR